MPISNATLLSGGIVATTGGTSKAWTDVGETIKNGKKVSDLSVTDSRIRPTITVVNRPAALNSLGKYISKDKRTSKLVTPKILTDGSLAFNVLEQRFETHPETTDAEKAIMLSYGAQMQSDADFTPFQINGTTA